MENINATSNIRENASDSGFFAKIFRGDKVVWAIFMALCVISIIEIFSATSTIVYRQQNQWGPILRHVVFLIGGVGVILFIHNIPYRYFAYLIFVLLISIVLLLLTPVIGTTVNGAERWISIFGFTIQPSEIAKISLMGTIALLLAKQNGMNDGLLFKWMIGLMVVVCGIIAMDNLSTAALLFVVCFLLMFIGNVKLSRLLKLAGTMVAALLLFVFLLKIIPSEWTEKGALSRVGTWQNRIAEFGSHKEESEEAYFTITDDNYQVAHAKIAIANGGVFGVFPGNSSERDFLPQAYSDFIYAIIIEEMGFVGGIVVLFLYIFLLMRAGIIARGITKPFPRLLVMGSALLLCFQAFINMAVAVNLIPVTGQPLPLISRGGTSTLITCAYFGIILSADRFAMRKTDTKKGRDESSESKSPEKVTDKLEEKIEFEVVTV